MEGADALADCDLDVLVVPVADQPGSGSGAGLHGGTAWEWLATRPGPSRVRGRWPATVDDRHPDEEVRWQGRVLGYPRGSSRGGSRFTVSGLDRARPSMMTRQGAVRFRDRGSLTSVPLCKLAGHGAVAPGGRGVVEVLPGVDGDHREPARLRRSRPTVTPSARTKNACEALSGADEFGKLIQTWLLAAAAVIAAGIVIAG